MREGYGIEPDLFVSPFASRGSDGRDETRAGFGAVARSGPGPLETALERDAAFFLFAGVLVTEGEESLRDAAARGGHLVLPNGTLDSFGAWLNTRGCEFRTPFEHAVAELDASREGGDVQSALDRLHRAAAADRGRAFEQESDRLLTRITQEAAARLMGPEDAVRALMPDDVWMQAAGEVLNDRSRYDRMLKDSW